MVLRSKVEGKERKLLIKVKGKKINKRAQNLMKMGN